jgi:hypothetical protein
MKNESVKQYLMADDVGGSTYLTAGRKYEVVEDHGDYKWIVSDSGCKFFVCIKCCHHLDGKPWRIVTDADTPSQTSEPMPNDVLHTTHDAIDHMVTQPTPRDDGGPAFPLAPVGTGDPRDGMAGGSVGMSFRDWFAGTATDADVEDFIDRSRGIERATARYMHADAMLKARAL